MTMALAVLLGAVRVWLVKRTASQGRSRDTEVGSGGGRMEVRGKGPLETRHRAGAIYIPAAGSQEVRREVME